jgi:hypothetical protein
VNLLEVRCIAHAGTRRFSFTAFMSLSFLAAGFLLAI